MKLSLGYQVLIAAVLGIFAGLFFGPLTKFLQPVGQAFVMLLQMLVLPYIAFSIMHGLGSTTPQIGKQLLKKGWPFLVILWSLVFIVVYFLDHLVPGALHESVAHPPKNENVASQLLTFLVPGNPFYDLVNNVVPAIAVLGVIIGVALMHLEKKEPLLGLLERSNQIIEKILKWLAIVSPIGVFAELAVAMGTVDFSDLYKLEFYVICFIVATLFLTLWVLPMLLSALTPIRFREALEAFRNVCLLSFATGLPTIAIPFINMYMRKLGERYPLANQNYRTTTQTVVPLAYAFAQIGNYFILFFIFFISFFYRHPFLANQKSILMLINFPLSIGSSATPVTAVSFLINWLHFPEQAVQLYIETMAVTLNFQVLLSVAGVLTFILLVVFSYYDLLQIQWKKLASGSFFTLAFLIAAVFASRSLFRVGDHYGHLYEELSIAKIISDPVPAQIYTPGETFPPSTGRPQQMSYLENILRRGILKVGYDPNNIPYCYWNDKYQLAGYDIAMAYQLARDLDCKLELIPLNLAQMPEELSSDLYDVAMSAILVNEERIARMGFTHYYSEQHNVLVVPAAKKTLFEHLSDVELNPHLAIGGTGGYSRVAARHFPLAKQIVGEGVKDLLTGKADAWVWSFTPASIWCLNHPNFVVIDYGESLGNCFFAYGVPSSSFDWTSFLNNWMSLKKQTGFTQIQYNYWILGQEPEESSERWSIIRDVLHWVH